MGQAVLPAREGIYRVLLPRLQPGYKADKVVYHLPSLKRGIRPHVEAQIFATTSAWRMEFREG